MQFLAFWNYCFQSWWCFVRVSNRLHVCLHAIFSLLNGIQKEMAVLSNNSEWIQFLAQISIALKDGSLSPLIQSLKLLDWKSSPIFIQYFPNIIHVGKVEYISGISSGAYPDSTTVGPRRAPCWPHRPCSFDIPVPPLHLWFLGTLFI